MKIKDLKIIKWAKRHKVLTGIILALLVLYIVFSNWIYWGRVVDAETGKPIEGAVVVAKWEKEAPSIAGGLSSVWKVKETLTDEEGKWMMRGPKGDSMVGIILSFAFIPRTVSPQFIVYKPGYCPWPKGSWSIEACKEMYAAETLCDDIGCGEDVGLPKLTAREDRRRALPHTIGPSAEFIRKQKEFFRLINEERRNLGLKESEYYYQLFGGDESEK